MVILDTNIIIDHLRKQSRNKSLLEILIQRVSSDQIGLSILSIQELFTGISTLDENKKNYLLATISPLKIFPYTFEIAQKAGEITRDLRRPLLFVDAAISATTIVNEGELLTLNVKDFINIKDLKLYKI